MTRSRLVLGLLIVAGGCWGSVACGGGSRSSSTATPNGATPSPTQAAAATATARPTPLPVPTIVASAGPCAKDGYAVTLSAQGATGGVAIGIGFASKGAPCTVTDDLRVAVYDHGGVPLLGMAANPASFSTGFTVGAQPVTRVVTWSNWCAAPGTFTAAIAVGAASATAAIAAPPRCDAPSQKSALALHP